MYIYAMKTIGLDIGVCKQIFITLELSIHIFQKNNNGSMLNLCLSSMKYNRLMF